ncbi:ATP-binding protein [Streptomyces sp. LaPpAH-108]|uniref:ATP-binding protein n=1 Tax=Streptomyces sp. LaPpAH-108 TaxID=1155714 RepID=UPI0018F87A36|nr:ATP-binding protein [Streptomyces sp. LaPpAH-108]
MGTNGSTMLKPLRQGLPPLDPGTVSEAASCALPARYEAVREARRFTRATLERWDVGARAEDIALVVSELVTNALRHALPGAGRPDGGVGGAASAAERAVEHSAPVRLHLMRWPGRLVCAVRDPSHETPVPRESDDFSAESGRGLFLVDSFADGWGWHPLAGALDGKMVWALFLLPAGEPAG